MWNLHETSNFGVRDGLMWVRRLQVIVAGICNIASIQNIAVSENIPRSFIRLWHFINDLLLIFVKLLAENQRTMKRRKLES